MEDQPSKPRPPSRAGKGPTPGSFKPGDPRINRTGRPRAGLAFAERGRERIDPDKVLDLAVKVLDDETLPARERLAIVMPVVDRIYVKPPTQTQLEVSQTNGESDFSHLSIERRRELLAELAGQDARPSPASTQEDPDTSPSNCDDESSDTPEAG